MVSTHQQVSSIYASFVSPELQRILQNCISGFPSILSNMTVLTLNSILSFTSLVDETPHLHSLGNQNQKLSLFFKNLDFNAVIFLDSNVNLDDIAAAGERIIIIVLYGGLHKTHNLGNLRYNLFVKDATKTNFNLARLAPTRNLLRFHSHCVYHK